MGYENARQSEDEWTCSRCTSLNPRQKLYCMACFQRHPCLSTLPSAYINYVERGSDNYYDYADKDDDNANSPAVFSTNNDDRQRMIGNNNDNNHGVIVENMNTNSRLENDILGAQADEDLFHKKLRQRMRCKLIMSFLLQRLRRPLSRDTTITN